MRKVRIEAKTLEKHIVVERNGAFSHYHDVLRLIRGIVKGADQRNADFTDTLTQSRILFEEGRSVKAVTLSAVPSRERLWTAKLASALKAKESGQQTLLGPTADHSTLRTKFSRLRNSVMTIGKERKRTVMLTSVVRDLAVQSKNIQGEPTI